MIRERAWRMPRDQASAASCSRARPCVARRIRLGGRRGGQPAKWRCGLRSREILRSCCVFFVAGASRVWLYRVNGGGGSAR